MEVHGLPPDATEPTRIVRVRILEGVSLAKKDIFGASDPYVRIQLVMGNDVIATANTKTVKKSLNPKWYEDFHFRVIPASHTLLFEVFDENRLTRDDFLGMVELPLRHVPFENARTWDAHKEYVLRPRSSRSRVRGFLRMTVAYTRDGVTDETQNEDADEPTEDEVNSGWEVVNREEQNETDSSTSDGSGSSQPSTPASRQQPALPLGWEERQDANGRVYYVDHRTRRTQWDRPASIVQPSPLGLNESQQERARQIYIARRHISRDDNLDSPAPANDTAEVTEQEQQPQQPVVDDPLGPLPAGWQKQLAPNGRTFFIDHNTRKTTWHDPRLSPNVDELGKLPPGWEQRVHADGRVFFIDHNTKSTQWEDPRLQNPEIAGPAVPYSRDYKKKYDFFKLRLKKPSNIPNKFELKLKRSSILEDSYRGHRSEESRSIEGQTMDRISRRNWT